MIVGDVSTLRRELRRRRQPFRIIPTMITLGLSIAFATASGLLVVSLINEFHHDLANDRLPGSEASLTVGIVIYAVLAAFIRWRLPSLARRSLESLGLRRLSIRDVALAAGVAVLLFAAQVFGLTRYLILVHAQGHVQAGFANFHLKSIQAWVLAVVAFAVAAPVAEELLFRGLILNALAVRTNVVAAVLVSSLLFGMAHGDAVLLPVLTLNGIAFALVYRYTENLYASMLVHGFGNLIVLFL